VNSFPFMPHRRAAFTFATDWERLELTFTAIENEPCGVVQFAVSGEGEWFIDDVLWEEL